MSELKRDLVAIMFTDMVGYTALMQADEALGLKKRIRHKEAMEQLHPLYGGQIIQYFGDGTLSIFSNSYDAVQCAIEIQKAFKEPIEIPLRIGIHAGNVIIQEDGIIGDAVNIASRIESFANVGGVLVSDSVQDQIKNHSDWTLVHLGKFHLKNVDRPFEIYAVSAVGLNVPNKDFLKGKGEKFARLKGSIPHALSELLGRETEVRDLISLLVQHNVVTITGTGGMGKTRLALEICQQLKSEFQDGVAFISMATLTDAKEVIPTLAAALDIKEAEGRELIDGVAALISDKSALIVLDNLEQVISAATEISQLVLLCPNLKILCTSRTPLKIKAEYEYILHPLQIPEKLTSAPLLNYPAIELFVQRAKKVNIDFELNADNRAAVLEICRRMDGLPLALELAAARIRILPPDKLLSRLSRALDVLVAGSKDLPERHQTLRATIDWSHNLLNEKEKRLFRRLGVFTSGFTLEAIEEVCYEDENAAFAAMDELESLLDKGLLVNVDGGSRFSLLQTIKDFALEQLKAAEEAQATFVNHAHFYFKVSDILRRGTQGEQQSARLKQGVLEDANIQAALDYLLERAKTGDEKAREIGLNIVGNLFMYWHIRGKHQSGKNRILALLEASENQEPTIGKCRALFHLHIATFTLGEIQECTEVGKRNYEMADKLMDPIEMAKSAFSMCFGYLMVDLATAKKYSEECVDRFRKLDDDSWMGWALWQNGVVSLIGGDLVQAKKSYAESFLLFKKLGDNEGTGCALSGLAMIEFISGNHQTAIEQYQSALRAYELVGDRTEEARVLSEISWTYLAQKNTTAAREYTLESIQAYQEVGSTRGIGLSMNGLAAIEAVEGRPSKALQIASAAEHFAKQEGVAIEYGANNHGLVYLDLAKEQLSESEIEMARAKGMLLTLKEVLTMTNNEVEVVV